MPAGGRALAFLGGIGRDREAVDSQVGCCAVDFFSVHPSGQTDLRCAVGLAQGSSTAGYSGVKLEGSPAWREPEVAGGTGWQR
jgi:hypothetical protein